MEQDGSASGREPARQQEPTGSSADNRPRQAAEPRQPGTERTGAPVRQEPKVDSVVTTKGVTLGLPGQPRQAVWVPGRTPLPPRPGRPTEAERSTAQEARTPMATPHIPQPPRPQPPASTKVVNVVTNTGMSSSVERLPLQGSRPAGDGPGPGGPSDEAIDAAHAASRTRLAVRAREAGLEPGAGSQPSRESLSPSARKGTTVAQSTLAQYGRRGQQLFERFRREGAGGVSPSEIDPVDWVIWLFSLKVTLKSSAWRSYRQAALHLLDGFPGGRREEALALLDKDVIDRSRAPTPAKAPGSPGARRTSSAKMKSFPWEDFDKLTVYLKTFSRSTVADAAVDWLRAGLLTGLRPSEWQATDLEIREAPEVSRGRRAWLYVLNAKATNGRGTGVVRTLDVSAFPDADIECIRRMSDRGRQWFTDGKFGEKKGQVSSLIYTAGERIWPSRVLSYCLYSCRHQASANFKVVLRPDEIAAVMGHGTTATAAEHYGKRRSGWSPERIPVPPRPVPEELAMVRKEMKYFGDRIKLQQRAGLRREGDTPEFPVP